MSKSVGRGIKAKNYTGRLRRPGEPPVQDGGDSTKDVSDASKATEENVRLSEEKPEVRESGNDSTAATKEVDKGSEERVILDTEKQTKSTLEEAGSSQKPAEKKAPVSSLSTAAPEFVPRRSISSNSVLANAVNAPAFVPRRIPPLLRRRSSKAEDALVNTVKDVLWKLTESPGEFDNQLSILTHTWSKRPCDQKGLEEIVELIFEQSVLESNFRYTGSKLAHYISSHQENLPGGEKFRGVFLNRCKQELLKKEELLSNPDTVGRVYGYAMFLGELFCNFKVQGQPFLVLLKGLLETLDALAIKCSDESISCVAQILMMTGYLVDDKTYVYKDFEKTSEMISKLFKHIEAGAEDSSKLRSGTKELLKKVLRLRKNKWGTMVPDNVVPPGDVDPTPAGIPVEYFGEEEPEANDFLTQYYNLGRPQSPDFLTPVTNPEQWSDYDDDTNFTNAADYTYYYFPEQSYYQDDSGGQHDYGDSSYEDDIDREFEEFLAEQDQGHYS